MNVWTVMMSSMQTSKRSEVNLGKTGQYDNDEFENNETNDFVYQFPCDGDNGFEIPGPYYQQEIDNKHEARDIMKFSGWLDKLSHVENCSFQWFSSKISLTHIRWASCIKAE